MKDILVVGIGASRTEEIEEFVRAIGRALRLGRIALEVVVLSAREMIELKRKSGLTRISRLPPDVLAFPSPAGFPHPEIRGRYFGEIYLNDAIVRRNRTRAFQLLLHGFLHLLGYDHRRIRDARAMERLEHILWQRTAFSD